MSGLGEVRKVLLKSLIKVFLGGRHRRFGGLPSQTWSSGFHWPVFAWASHDSWLLALSLAGS
jgi:hypothetical protein